MLKTTENTEFIEDLEKIKAGVSSNSMIGGSEIIN